MANKSTLFINGIQISEMAGSGKVVYTKTNTVGTRIFLVPWNKKNDLIRFILGTVFTNENGSISVSSAMPFNTDKDPSLFADSLTQDPFVANALEDENKEIEYEYSVLTVTYVPRDEQEIVGRNNNGTIPPPTGDTTSALLMTLRVSSSVENVTIPDSEKNWSFVEADSAGYGFNSKKLGTVKSGQVTKIVPFLNWTLSYKQQEKLRLPQIRKSLQSPLQSTVASLSQTDGVQNEDIRGLGRVRRGTMLFLGFDATQDSVLLQGAGQPSKKAWNITFKFKEHPFGWNYIYQGKPDLKSRPDSLPRKGWIPLKGPGVPPVPPDTVGTFETLYRNSNFNNFLPKID